MKPKISIIVPVYNVDKLLEKCINSILYQTFTNFELILVNDGSTDRSGEICDFYSFKDNRIKVIHKVNGGVSSARNSGLDIAEGEYISFIDSDDYIRENMMENLYRATLNSKVDLVVSGIFFERTDNKSWENYLGYYEAYDKNQMRYIIKKLFNSYLLYNPVAKLYKRSLIEDERIRFNESMSFGEDPVFNCCFFKHVSNCINLDKCYYCYVRHGVTSLSNRFDSSKMTSNKIMHEKLTELLNFYNIFDDEANCLIKSRYSKELCDMIFTINRTITKVTFKEKYRFLNEIFYNKEYKFLSNYLSGVNYILRYLIRKKYSALIIFYFTFARFIKR